MYTRFMAYTLKRLHIFFSKDKLTGGSGMNDILKWFDSPKFDELLLTGSKRLFWLAALGCLPYILWNMVMWLI